jgi:hypothetical protein
MPRRGAGHSVNEKGAEEFVGDRERVKGEKDGEKEG